jgi:hypothetical protein
MPDDATEGKNPPDGAAINFWLKTAPADLTGKGAVVLTIADAQGQTLRTIDASKDARAGMNRIWWDLRTDPSTDFVLRTPPLYGAENRLLGPDGTRKLAVQAPLSILVPPGAYKVTLKAAGETATQDLVVLKDPNTAGSEADVAAQTKVMREVRDNMAQAAEAVNRIESVRAQLASLRQIAGEDEKGKRLTSGADAVDAKLLEVEKRLFNVTATGRGQDQLRFPAQLVEKLGHLADTLQLADFAPTDQQLEVHRLLTAQLVEIKQQLNQVVTTDVAAFNGRLRQQNVGTIVIK